MNRIGARSTPGADARRSAGAVALFWVWMAIVVGGLAAMVAVPWMGR